MLKALNRKRSDQAKATVRTWHPEFADRKTFEMLLDQQFWCFGRDITLAPRNALVEYGFVRHPKPRGNYDGSCYAQRSRQGTVLALWGFGVYFANQHGILLTRRSSCPFLSDHVLNPVGVWSPSDLTVRSPGMGDAPIVLPLMARLCRWFSQYETWILAERPKNFGKLSLDGWMKIVMPRSEMAAAWEAFALELEELIGRNDLQEPAA